MEPHTPEPHTSESPCGHIVHSLGHLRELGFNLLLALLLLLGFPIQSYVGIFDISGGLLLLLLVLLGLRILQIPRHILQVIVRRVVELVHLLRCLVFGQSTASHEPPDAESESTKTHKEKEDSQPQAGTRISVITFSSFRIQADYRWLEHLTRTLTFTPSVAALVFVQAHSKTRASLVARKQMAALAALAFDATLEVFPALTRRGRGRNPRLDSLVRGWRWARRWRRRWRRRRKRNYFTRPAIRFIACVRWHALGIERPLAVARHPVWAPAASRHVAVLKIWRTVVRTRNHYHRFRAPSTPWWRWRVRRRRRLRQLQQRARPVVHRLPSLTALADGEA
mmetsp:Transcript_9363/g.21085  ORF Transcript_9363/g.21085 Transcript_9363/m.21085 type:complete len:338 (+) Transcript_9363:586-1599(+)